MGNQASGFAYDIGEPVGATRTHWQLHKGKKKVGGVMKEKEMMTVSEVQKRDFCSIDIVHSRLMALRFPSSKWRRH